VVAVDAGDGWADGWGTDGGVRGAGRCGVCSLRPGTFHRRHPSIEIALHLFGPFFSFALFASVIVGVFCFSPTRRPSSSEPSGSSFPLIAVAFQLEEPGQVEVSSTCFIGLSRLACLGGFLTSRWSVDCFAFALFPPGRTPVPGWRCAEASQRRQGRHLTPPREMRILTSLLMQRPNLPVSRLITLFPSGAKPHFLLIWTAFASYDCFSPPHVSPVPRPPPPLAASPSAVCKCCGAGGFLLWRGANAPKRLSFSARALFPSLRFSRQWPLLEGGAFGGPAADPPDSGHATMAASPRLRYTGPLARRPAGGSAAAAERLGRGSGEIQRPSPHLRAARHRHAAFPSWSGLLGPPVGQDPAGPLWHRLLVAVRRTRSSSARWLACPC